MNAKPHENKSPSTISSQPAVPARRAFQTTRRTLAGLANDGVLDHRLMQCILDEEGFIPVEGTLLDYKRDPILGRDSIVKLMTHIVAMYNTYGGYLILGADEVERGQKILPVLHECDEPDEKQLNDLLREYTGVALEVKAKVLVADFRGVTIYVQVLHVPQRGVAPPLCFRRDGPQDHKGRKIFEREKAYLRDGDNSVPAERLVHYQLIFGERQNPFLYPLNSEPSPTPIWNNLPDRSFICADFVGREDVLADLYEWLSDDFSSVRVIAGEGGLGKTSIAFEFATAVSKSHLCQVDRVLWLTAKKAQFRALDNQFEPLSSTSFSSWDELFHELANQMGCVDGESRDVPEIKRARFLKGLVENIRIFAVIDDLDSLTIDDQKRSIEVCQQLSGLGSRFLFTTRKNATAAAATAIALRGLDTADFLEFIESWRRRLNLREFSAKDIDRLEKTSQGSPLFAESLLRLLRGGMNVQDAVAKWNGKLGVEVRNAALQHEVLQLGAEARKVLAAAAVFVESSFAELREATGFAEQTLLDAINELQSLFLVNAPAIATQTRFAVSHTTRELVLSLGDEGRLFGGYDAAKRGWLGRREKLKGTSDETRLVGAAINQANSLLHGGDSAAAIKTVDEINKKFGGRNKDLLLMRAKALTRTVPPQNDMARKAFQAAYDNGQRKLLLFELWFGLEMTMRHYEAAIEVCTHAIEASAGSTVDWLVRRSETRIRFAASLGAGRSDESHSRDRLVEAGEDILRAVASTNHRELRPEWREMQFLIHDQIWNLDVKTADSAPAWILATDDLLRALEVGDTRIEVYARLPVALRAIEREFSAQTPRRSSGQANLLGQRARAGLSRMHAAPSQTQKWDEFRSIERQVRQIADEYS